MVGALGLILEDAASVLIKRPLCDPCLGRQFGGLARGVTNRERGIAIKLVLAMAGHASLERGEEGGRELLKALSEQGGFAPASSILGEESGAKECHLCEGITGRTNEYAEAIARSLSDYDYSNFLLGVRISGELAEREDELRSEFGLEHGESLKMECSREIGKEVARITGKEVEFARPDIVVTVDLPEFRARLKPMPLYIMGRYRKLVRGIPQSKWDCVHCRGRGCEVCHGTGKIYPISVEEIVSGPILEATAGTGTKFHGAGREDVDAIMAGNGRPFVVEVKDSVKRRPDLGALEAAINRLGDGRVEVLGLGFSDKKTVRGYKEKAKVAEKTYRALVEVGRPVTEGELRQLEKGFNGCLLNQYTPQRVLHRRADKLRVKRVHELKAAMAGGTKIELVVRCQGGLYVKELISGDGGRTKPSIAEALGAETRCVELDVISVNEAI
jgi:tRNA pseudouridine synthase 10